MPQPGAVKPVADGGASCAPLVQRTVLNHYAYQSVAAWEAKKRGNVLGRKGAVPEIYEKVRDDTGAQLLSERIRIAHAATPRPMAAAAGRREWVMRARSAPS